MKKIYGFIIILVLLFMVSHAGAIELTQEDRAVLAHVVVDPDAWVAHALIYAQSEVDSEQAQLDALNALIVEGKQIDPRQKINLENRLLVPAEDRFVKFVVDKIANHRKDYLAKKDLPGYKTRADQEISALTEKGKTEDQARAMLGLPPK